MRDEELWKNFAWLNRFTLSLLKHIQTARTRHETSQLWLERELHAESPCWSSGLVNAASGFPALERLR